MNPDTVTASVRADRTPRQGEPEKPHTLQTHCANRDHTLGQGSPPRPAVAGLAAQAPVSALAAAPGLVMMIGALALGQGWRTFIREGLELAIPLNSS